MEEGKERQLGQGECNPPPSDPNSNSNPPMTAKLHSLFLASGMSTSSPSSRFKSSSIRSTSASSASQRGSTPDTVTGEATGRVSSSADGGLGKRKAQKVKGGSNAGLVSRLSTSRGTGTAGDPTAITLHRDGHTIPPSMFVDETGTISVPGARKIRR